MKTKRVSATVSSQASEALDVLVKSGFYGRTRADVVRESVYRTIREALRPQPMGLGAMFFKNHPILRAFGDGRTK